MHKGNHHHKRQEQIHLRPLGGLRPVAQLMRGQKEHNLGELKRNTAPEPAGRDFSISHQMVFLSPVFSCFSAFSTPQLTGVPVPRTWLGVSRGSLSLRARWR